MKLYLLLYLITLFFHISYQCISKEKKDVDWWVYMKVTSTTKGFYMDSTMNEFKFMKWEEKDLSQFFHHNIDLENYSFDFVQDQPSSMNKNWKRVYKSYRHAHSKYILGFPLKKDIDPIIIETSFPETPYRISQFRFFPLRKERNVFKYSQHAVCIKFKDIHKDKIIDAINFTGPLFVGDIHTDEFRNVDLYGNPEGKDPCTKAFKEEIEGKTNSEILKLKNFKECTKEIELAEGKDKITLIAHAQVVHNGDDIDETTFETASNPKNAPKLNIDEQIRTGPIPWLTAAKIFDIGMYIYTWKNTPLPNIIWGEKSIIMASNLEFVDDNNYKYLWNLNAHEKIGVTIDNKIACFADANHRHSEVSHAGIMICIHNEKLATSLGSMMAFRYDNKNRIDNIVIDDSKYPEGYKEDKPHPVYFSHFAGETIIDYQKKKGIRFTHIKRGNQNLQKLVQENKRNASLNNINKKRNRSTDDDSLNINDYHKQKKMKNR